MGDEYRLVRSKTVPRLMSGKDRGARSGRRTVSFGLLGFLARGLGCEFWEVVLTREDLGGEMLLRSEVVQELDEKLF